MSAFRDLLKKAGYSLEDLWHYKKDRELIEKMKRKNLRVIEGGKSAAAQGATQEAATSSPSEEVQDQQRKKAA